MHSQSMRRKSSWLLNQPQSWNPSSKVSSGIFCYTELDFFKVVIKFIRNVFIYGFNLCFFCFILDRDQFQLATLSHLIDNKATGYQEIPEWPEEAPDPSVRNVEVTMPWLESKSKERKKAEKKKSFYSDEDSSSVGKLIFTVFS